MHGTITTKQSFQCLYEYLVSESLAKVRNLSVTQALVKFVTKTVWRSILRFKPDFSLSPSRTFLDMAPPYPTPPNTPAQKIVPLPTFRPGDVQCCCCKQLMNILSRHYGPFICLCGHKRCEKCRLHTRTCTRNCGAEGSVPEGGGGEEGSSMLKTSGD